MRIVRTVAAVLTALALSFSILAIVGPGAHATLPKRDITTDTKQKSYRGFAYKGTVQDYADGKVIVQKKTCKRCRYRKVEKIWTNERMKFRTRIYAPWNGKAWYRVRVPRSDGYRATKSKAVILTLR